MDKPCPATFCTEPLPDWSDVLNHIGGDIFGFLLPAIPLGLFLALWAWTTWKGIKRPSE